MGTQERICGLCLNICDNFKAIEGDMKHVLDVVVPKMDLATIQELVMCSNCTGMLMKCFDFKAACFYAHDYIIPLVNGKDDVKVNLKDVYLRKNENDTGVLEDKDICGFCMNPVTNSSAVSLDVEDRVLTLKEMTEQCLPELDLSIIKKPVICPTCHGSLENCFRFVTNYLSAKESIKQDCKTLDIKSKSQIELNSFLHFTTRNVTVNEINGNSVVRVKVEEQSSEERENGEESKISNRSDTFKLEQMSCEEENLVKMEDQKYLFNEEIEIKTEEEDCNRSEYGDHLPLPEVTSRLYVRLEHLMPNLEGRQSDPCIKNTLHKNPSKVTVYKCGTCSYETNLDIKPHLLVHKNPSEVTIYKCESCSFQTRQKSSLRRHLLCHKDPSEVIMYKCAMCLYQTNSKYTLKLHLQLHKDPSKVTMYKCVACSYQSKVKHYITRHMRCCHKNLYKGTVYKCESCSFQARRESSLKIHLLLHKNSSGVTIMYKCDICSFQTKYKNSLKNHVLLHKSPSKVTMYKCESCSHQTKRIDHLKRHLLLHKDPSKVTMYKCESCPYQTKRKDNLKVHLRKHEDPKEVIISKK